MECIKYIYVFVRGDIPIAQQAVQACHVCFEMGHRYRDPRYKDTAHLVLLKVKDQSELFNVQSKLDAKGIDSYIFYEPDNDMKYSALCTEPMSENRNMFKKYNLWKVE